MSLMTRIWCFHTSRKAYLLLLRVSNAITLKAVLPMFDNWSNITQTWKKWKRNQNHEIAMKTIKNSAMIMDAHAMITMNAAMKSTASITKQVNTHSWDEC